MYIYIKTLILREALEEKFCVKVCEKCGKVRKSACEKVPKRFCPLVVALEFFSDLEGTKNARVVASIVPLLAKHSENPTDPGRTLQRPTETPR